MVDGDPGRLVQLVEPRARPRRPGHDEPGRGVGARAGVVKVLQDVAGRGVGDEQVAVGVQGDPGHPRDEAVVVRRQFAGWRFGYHGPGGSPRAVRRTVGELQHLAASGGEKIVVAVKGHRRDGQRGQLSGPRHGFAGDGVPRGAVGVLQHPGRGLGHEQVVVAVQGERVAGGRGDQRARGGVCPRRGAEGELEDPRRTSTVGDAVAHEQVAMAVKRDRAYPTVRAPDLGHDGAEGGEGPGRARDKLQHHVPHGLARV